MENSQKVSLKLMIDRKRKRVVFAESDKDFVEILLNFLTLPLGTIIRLTGKKSSPLGCLNTMYKSVENLDQEYFEIQACKNMLLQPRGASEMYFEHLKLNVNDLKPTEYYKCPDDECRMIIFPHYSLVPGAQCCCGRTMDLPFVGGSIKESKDGVFLKGSERFIISDDFHLLTACNAQYLSLLRSLDTTDGTVLERRDEEVGKEEVLKLLQRSLLSKTALSDVFLGLKNRATLGEDEESNVESGTRSAVNKVELKFVVNKENNQMLYAEANGEFINLLFSILTFPLGLAIKLLDKPSLFVCAENLYMSLEDLIRSECELIKFEECVNMLLNPELAAHFGWSNQVLKIDESPPEELIYNELNVCINPVNPKLPDPGNLGSGGVFVKGSSTFMVTGDLVVTPMSPVAAIELINERQVPITSLEERIINVGESKALNLLKATLISGNALSTTLSSRRRSSRRSAQATSTDKQPE